MSKEKIISEIINNSLKLNIFENTRKREVVDARSLYCYILRKDLNYTLYQVRDTFRAQGKNYDHATVMHNVKIYEVVLINNPSYKELRELILNEVCYKTVILNKIEQIKDEEKLRDINNCINYYE